MAVMNLQQMQNWKRKNRVMRKFLLFLIGLLGFTATACDPEPADMYGPLVKDFEETTKQEKIENTTGNSTKPLE